MTDFATEGLFDPPGFQRGVAPGRAAVGLLLIHGFSGGPADMRYLAENLAARRWSAPMRIAVPALEGHRLNGDPDRRLHHGVGWAPIWKRQAAVAFEELESRSEAVVIAGLSMGALVTLLTAAAFADRSRLKGVILFSTPLQVNTQRLRPIIGVMSRVRPERPWKIKQEVDVADATEDRRMPLRKRMTLGAIESFFRLQPEAAQALGEIRVPVLAIHSRQDHTAPFDNLARLQRGLGAAESVETMVLQRSFWASSRAYARM